MDPANRKISQETSQDSSRETSQDTLRTNNDNQDLLASATVDLQSLPDNGSLTQPAPSAPGAYSKISQETSQDSSRETSQDTSRSNNGNQDLLASATVDLQSLPNNGSLTQPAPAAPGAYSSTSEGDLVRAHKLRLTAPPIAGNEDALEQNNTLVADPVSPEPTSHLMVGSGTVGSRAPGENSGISVAFLVPEEEEDGSPCELEIPRANDVDLEAAQKRQRKTKQTKSRVIIVVSILLALVLILVPVLAHWKGQADQDNPPIPPPSQPPTLSLENHVLSLLPNYTLAVLEEDEGSPQARAYSWLLDDPNLSSYSDERIVQRFALGTLFHATGGEDWRKKTNWMSYEVHECNWHAQDVVKITRNMYKLSGEQIPDAFEDVAFLPYLNASYPCENPIVEQTYSHLWLMANNLEGKLPPELYLLTSLKTVDVTLNSLTRSGLSTTIGKLSSLEVFSAANNGLSGMIPTEIGLLSKLQVIALRGNLLVGTIPTQFGLLSDNLRALDLNGNQLSGTIPESLVSLPKVAFLSLFGNQLSGTIPTELGMLKESRWLDLGSNELEGPIPSEMGLLKSLSHMWLDRNQLTGSVPGEIGDLVAKGDLDWFHTFKNNLTGTLPDALCLIYTLSDYNPNLTGCNCTCSFELSYVPDLQVCSPLADQCE